MTSPNYFYELSLMAISLGALLALLGAAVWEKYRGP